MIPLDREYLLNNFVHFPDGKLFRIMQTKLKLCGTPNDAGYLAVKIKKQMVLVHRIVWTMHYSDPVDMQIDHIDNNPGNNRTENLRLATPSQNKQNQWLSHTDSWHSKIVGVYYHKREMKWRASLMLNGIYVFMQSFNTEAEAAEARLKAEKEFFTHSPKRK